MISGVYLIYCASNNKSYVGSSVHINRRWDRHIYDLKNNKHCNTHLQRSWNKYSQSNFKFIILELCDDFECVSLESKYIDSIKPEFNICHYGWSRLGVKHSQKSKNKISNSHTGKEKSKSHIQKINDALRGKKRPYLSNNKEWKRKLGKPVICVTTGDFYHTVKEAELATGATTIARVCNGKQKTSNGLSWRWVNQ